LQIISYLQALK